MKKGTLVLGVAVLLAAAGVFAATRSGLWSPGGAVAQSPRPPAVRTVPVEVAARAEDPGSGAHRCLGHGDPHRQRRGQDPGGQRNRRRPFPRRCHRAAGRSALHARQPRHRGPDQAGHRRARGRQGAARTGRTRCRALHRTVRQECHDASDAQQCADAGDVVAGVGRTPIPVSSSIFASSSATAPSARRFRGAQARPRSRSAISCARPTPRRSRPSSRSRRSM